MLGLILAATLASAASPKPTVTPQPIEVSQDDREQLLPRIMEAQRRENSAAIEAEAFRALRQTRQAELARKYGLRDQDVWQYQDDGRLHYKGIDPKVIAAPQSVSGTAR